MTHGVNDPKPGTTLSTKVFETGQDFQVEAGLTSDSDMDSKSEDISGITSRKDLFGEGPDNEPRPSQLTEQERLSIVTRPENLSVAGKVEDERIAFHRLSVLALNNGTGWDDRNTEEYDEFFNPEHDIEGGKRKLSEFLDRLELSEVTLDPDFNYEYARARAKRSILGNLANGAKEIGKFFFTAIPKAIDALLPVDLQTTPKLEMINGLQEHKATRAYEAEHDYQKDLSALNRRYGAIKDYVVNFYGDLIVPFNIHEPAELTRFMQQCLEDESSLHFQNVQRLIDTRVAARKAQLLQTKAQIESDKSSKETIKEIRESSWLLRTADRVKAKLGQWKDKATDFYMTKVGKPALDMTLGYAKTELAIPVSKGVNLPITNNSPKVFVAQKPKTSGRWTTRLAAGLALLTAGLIHGDISKESSQITDKKDETAQLPEAAAQAADNQVTPAPVVDHQPIVDFPKVESGPKADPEPIVIEPVKPVVSKPVRKTAPVRPHRAVRQSMSTSSRYSAKAVITHKPDSAPVIQPAPTPDIEKPKTVEPTNTDIQSLSEAAKLAELRLVDGKVAGYKRRITNIQLDQHRYANLPETGLKIRTHLTGVSVVLDEIMTQMKTLENSTQIDQINADLQKIDSMLSAADVLVRAVNVADAGSANLRANDLLKKTKELSQSNGGRFNIVHNDKTKNSVTAYTVDTAQIQNRINTIQAQLKASSTLSVEQARMLQRDAEYWVGYLNFVNWYLQYNPKQVVSHY